jgi:protein KTI12
MPLIILAGYPCCGKTTFAEALKKRLIEVFLSSSHDETSKNEQDLTRIDKEPPADTEARVLVTGKESSAVRFDQVIIVNEESENIQKSEAYMFSSQEKTTRGVLKSAVNQRLNAKTIVICDSLNYIKGYRYELFCITKTFRTPHCVVWVESDEKVALQWNAMRKPEDRYEKAT